MRIAFVADVGTGRLARREGVRDGSEPADGVVLVKLGTRQDQRQRVGEPVLLLVTEDVAGLRQHALPPGAEEAPQVVAAQPG